MRLRCGLFVSGLLVGTMMVSGCGKRGEHNSNAAGVDGDHRPRYGALMSDVGRRFELVGRAGVAHRWDLASFELHELEEVFEELPGAKQPGRAGEVNLRGLEQAFTNTHPPELRTALEAQDSAGFVAAFGRAAATCNGCHQATGHRFIEIPEEPGSGVPKLDPVP
jgi:hypothetical protein